MIARFAEWQGRHPASVVADATYGTAIPAVAEERNNHTVYAHAPPGNNALRKNNPLMAPSDFTYRPKTTAILSGWGTD